MDCFDNSAAMMRMQENRASFSVGKDGSTKYWDGEQCEVVGFVGEGTYDEGEGQEWITPSSNSSGPEYEVDEQDLQIALAMSEEDPRMDEELAKRLSELDSVPVSTCQILSIDMSFCIVIGKRCSSGKLKFELHFEG